MTKPAHPRLRPAARDGFDNEELVMKARNALGVMIQLRDKSGAPLDPRVTGAAIERACWTPNEGFQVRKLMLERNWMEIVGATRENPAGKHELTIYGREQAAEAIELSEDELEVILRNGKLPPSTLDNLKLRRSRRKADPSYRVKPTPEDGSPIDEDEYAI